MSAYRMIGAHVDRTFYERVASVARANRSSISAEVRRLVEMGLRDGSGAEALAAYCEQQAAGYEAAQAGKQLRTAPEPQLAKLKAEHWRILAKVCREGPRS